MKKVSRTRVLIGWVVWLLLFFNVPALFAQDFSVIENIPGESVTLAVTNFPPQMNYIVSMSDVQNNAFYQDTAKFNSGNGGYLIVKTKIPATFAGIEEINLFLTDERGSSVQHSFQNSAEAVEEELSAKTEAQVARDMGVCDYSTVPAFEVRSVNRGERVTIQTKDFPVGINFKVMMGDYADMGPAYAGSIRDRSLPASPFYFFNGTEIGSYRSENGAEEELTFSIPVEMAEYPAFILWLEEDGPCGLYAYSLIWNVTTEQTEISNE